MLSAIATLLWAIIIFSILVFVHELGHFLVAKYFNVLVHEFAIGMGPAIFKRQGKETLYSIRAIPIGGFCKMEGEDEDSDSPRAFNKKGKLPRVLILLAGSFMNLLLGFILMSLLFGAFVPSDRFLSPTINEVMPEFPAYEAGVKSGDKIIEVNGHKVNIYDDFVFYNNNVNKVKMKVKRGNEELSFNIVPKQVKIDKDGNIVDLNSNIEGTTKYLTGITPLKENKNAGTIIKNAYYKSISTSILIYTSLGQLITGKISGDQISGPVGIVREINNAAKSGVDSIIWLASVIAINLGLFNLLPFPALDGGRILFITIEAIIRKKIKPEFEGYFHMVGFALLIALMIYATGNDILKMFGK